MLEHPIQGLMTTTMNSIKDMIDVDTIIGNPIESVNGTVIIPISKVSFGFASAGSEFNGETVEQYKKVDKDEEIQYKLPFGGGSGAGVTINPVAFLVVQGESVKLLPVDHSSCLDRLLDYVPDLLEKAKDMTKKMVCDKQEETEKIINEISKRNSETTSDNISEKSNDIEK